MKTDEGWGAPVWPLTSDRESGCEVTEPYALIWKKEWVSVTLKKVGNLQAKWTGSVGDSRKRAW